MTYDTPRHQIVLGGVVLAVFAISAVVVFGWMRTDPRLFGKTQPLLTLLPERSSLQIGDPVEIDGVRVGTVRRVQREVEGGVAAFLVESEVRVGAEPLAWLGPQSRARARTINLLGDVVLSINGDPEGNGLASEEVIPGEASPSFDEVIADVRAASASVRSITLELEHALSAPTEDGVPRAEAVARSVRRTVAALELLVAGTNDQEGGRVAELLAELTASATQLREITEDIKAVTAKVRSFFGQ